MVACNELNRDHIVGFIFFTVERKSIDTISSLASEVTEDQCEVLLNRLSALEQRTIHLQESFLTLLQAVDTLLKLTFDCESGRNIFGTHFLSYMAAGIKGEVSEDALP